MDYLSEILIKKSLLDNKEQEIKKFIYNKSIQSMEKNIMKGYKDFTKKVKSYIHKHAKVLRINNYKEYKVRCNVIKFKDYNKNHSQYILIEPDNLLFEEPNLTKEEAEKFRKKDNNDLILKKNSIFWFFILVKTIKIINKISRW